MAKKRKSDATPLDEVDQTVYSAFCGAANSLSQLYSQAIHQQRLSFLAGERHSLEKIYTWMLRQQESGVRLMPGDVFAYIQNEFNFGIEDLPPQQQQSTQSEVPISSNVQGMTPRGLISSQTRDANNDTSMDMHDDSPTHDSPPY